jgi:hypothetical protein
MTEPAWTGVAWSRAPATATANPPTSMRCIIVGSTSNC